MPPPLSASKPFRNQWFAHTPESQRLPAPVRGTEGLSSHRLPPLAVNQFSVFLSTRFLNSFRYTFPPGGTRVLMAAEKSRPALPDGCLVSNCHSAWLEEDSS